MTYSKNEARRCGAQCDRCAFSQIKPAGIVGPEIKRTAKAVVVGEAPGGEEVQAEQPFVGKSGKMLMDALSAAGLQRRDVSVLNAVACRPAGNKMDRIRSQLKAINDERKENGQEPLLHPVQACRPRLLNDIARSGSKNVIVVGGVALEGVTGVRQSIKNARGAPMPVMESHPDLKVFPTLHPAFVLRQLRWRPVFTGDVARAFRWFNGKLGWKEPKVYYKPSLKQIQQFLSHEPKCGFFSFDIETDAIEPLLAKIRCIGISTEDVAIVIPFLSIDGQTRFYPKHIEESIKDELRCFFENPRKRKVGHNAGMYDKLAVEEWLQCVIRNLVDTILLHRSVESEMPHNLGYVGTVHTDIDRAWKSEHAATQAKSDMELWIYNALDTCITARITKPLAAIAKEREQWPVVQLDHKLQEVCVDMHRIGLRVDMKARDEWDRKLLKEAIHFRKECREAIGRPQFNPASIVQIKDLLYGYWDLPEQVNPKTKEVTTDDDAIRTLMMEPGLTPAQKRFLSALRMFRRRSKLRGTYIVKLKKRGSAYVLDEFAHDEDAEEEDYRSEEEEWRRRDEKKEGIIYADGRIRSSWNVHGTNTGRFSSSAPNLQNLPRKLRNIIIPEDGNVFVYADKDQLELRLVTMFSGAKTYSRVFAEGGDPHSTSTRMVLGDSCKAIYDAAVAKYGNEKLARKKDPDWARLCDFGKRFTYAAVYWATIETIHDVLRSSEDENENLIYADLTVEKTQIAYNSWMSHNPEIQDWWERCVAEYRANGYLCDAMTGRRCDFADGENANQIVNYGCQATGAGIVNKETLRFREQFPMGKYGKYTGIAQQGHDALMVETKRERGEDTKKLLTTSMTTEDVPGYEGKMRYTADAKIIEHWGKA